MFHLERRSRNTLIIMIKCFHTFDAYRHYQPLPFWTILMALNLTQGHKVSEKSSLFVHFIARFYKQLGRR